MATYQELLDLQVSTGGPVLSKIKIAIVVACDIIRAESAATDNHANRMLWARQTLNDPQGMALKMFWAVLAQNRGIPRDDILNATDVAVQNAVNTAVNLLAQGD